MGHPVPRRTAGDPVQGGHVRELLGYFAGIALCTVAVCVFVLVVAVGMTHLAQAVGA